MRKVIFLLTLASLLGLTSCESLDKSSKTLSRDKFFLVVEFDPQDPIKYKMVSERNIVVDLEANSEKSRPEKVTEKLELVMSYKAAGEPDLYGLTTIEATCHSAKVTRTGNKNAPAKDAVESLAGESFSFKVSSTGKIVDHSEPNALAAELGSKAFINEGPGRRFKKADMVADFVSMQWLLWDSVASAGQTAKGLKAGDSWTTRQFIPLPVPLAFKRDTTYTAGGVETSEDGDKRVDLNSTYAVGKGRIEHWPKLYSGSFNIRSTFGFLRNYRLQSIEGTGKQIFNVSRGVLEKDQQQYTAKITADLLLPLSGVSPQLTVNQKFSIELLDN